MRTGARSFKRDADSNSPKTSGPNGTHPGTGGSSLGVRAPVEELGLSARGRNALRGVGCATIEDVLRLDLSTAVRGLGRKTREEVAVKLKRAGFQLWIAEEPASEIRAFERSLERMQGRIDAALSVVAKEIWHLRQRLRKKMQEQETPHEDGAIEG